MRRAVDPPAADEEQPTCTSSQPLLKQDTPERPRWRTTRRDFYHDEKLMRGLKPRCCARLGLGTLIFL